MTGWVALSAGLLILAGPALAQPSERVAPPTGHADEIVVKARRPIVVVADTCPQPDPARHPSDQAPRVVDSYPTQGAVTAPGYVRVRVSFDQPMSCFSEVMVDGGQGDPCEPNGTWVLPERKSWMMSCRFQPGTELRIGFRRIDGQGFVGLSGRPATPFQLAFTTSDGPATPVPADAAARDPGPPDAVRRPTALVTCADTRRSPTVRRDCRREAIAPPE